MARQAETNLNYVLADILKKMAPKSDMKAENTRVLREGMSYQPDILIAASGRSPVIIEAEYEPARSVEEEAKQRLGAEPEGQTRPVEAVVALRYPAALKSAGNIKTEMKEAALQYCFFQEDADENMEEPIRFPETGWLEGTAENLSDLIRMISVPEKEINAVTEKLENGIQDAALVMDEDARIRPGLYNKIAKLLGMSNVALTRQMACAILGNALAFHERIAGMREDGEIDSLSQVFRRNSLNPQDSVLNEWEKILNINYYPIFAIAEDILIMMPSHVARDVLLQLLPAAQGAHLVNAHELIGRVFQRLVSDRKYLATFYTLPVPAALLARIAVAKIQGIEWNDKESIEQLRIADFACGTGALLAAVYSQIAARHEREGGDLNALHPAMMEKVLYGCDVMPSAVHITAASLSGAMPEEQYENSLIYTLPYNRQESGDVRIGSLELLRDDFNIKPLHQTSDPRRTGQHGDERREAPNVDMPHESYDLVIMNPPFTSATNHEGSHVNVINPAFAAFNAAKEDMRDMGKRLTKLAKDTCSHGNAGIASAFAALADKKLKPGGVLALVLPLTAVSGESWQKVRNMLAERYCDMDVLSIAANGHEMSFSSDTGMAECLIVARKKSIGSPPMSLARFTSLQRRPQSFVEAAVLAETVLHADSVRQIEDGPYGGDAIHVGGQFAGEMICMNPRRSIHNWAAARVADSYVAQTAYALTQSELWPPGVFKPINLKIVQMGEIGKRGFLSRDITGPAPRGPFDKLPPSPTATFPALWNHDNEKETRLICAPDSQLQVRRGLEEKAEEVWNTASRCHLNTEFTFGAQPLAVAFTERKSMGGRVWPNVIFEDVRFDYAFALWGNCALGLLSYWWHASRQQSSKASIAISTIVSMPTLDLRTLTDDQLSLAEEIFERFRDREFKPAYIADLDQARADLDRAVLCELLGFDEAVYEAVRKLSAKWAAEPSVRGGKRRP